MWPNLMTSLNQTPEQKARDKIDQQLQQAGWSVQDKDNINWHKSKGVAVRKYYTDDGKEMDYTLFVNRKPVGVVEAKRKEEGQKITVHERQAEDYARSKLKYLDNNNLPYVYESTGELTKYTNLRDPKPRAREVFNFHKPDTFEKHLKKEDSLRSRLQNLPNLKEEGLRGCQINAIRNLEKSLKNSKPRALIQMATGAGKTYTAITSIYRLLKYAHINRVLFLVDTRNLGEQAEQEFMAFQPNDDNRKFKELYNVQRLTSSYIPDDAQVCISTIQRVYSILKGEELEPQEEEKSPYEKLWKPKEPVPVVYNSEIPIGFFDFVVVDECHRSIYNLWQQVLDYFDSFIIGLTATPGKRTFAFFHENIVSEYSHEEAVADGVNVGQEVYTIETKITENGARLKAEEYIEKREKLSRSKRWKRLDEDVEYTKKDLDKDVVNKSQIRNIIRTFRQKLPEIFPHREEIPKTLVYAKSDSHADDIINIIREEFGEGNDFCKKVTYKSEEDPKSILSDFRNSYNPRIAVTVDMISTGTDIKPLECLLFMRDVKSRNYFEQMKGRGTRTIAHDDLKKVTPSARLNKSHYVIVDAVGVTKSVKTDSRPLERKKSVPLKDLLEAVTFGAQDEDLFLSLADRLSRMEKQINGKERKRFKELAGGKSINQVVKGLLNAYDPDKIEEEIQKSELSPKDTPPQEIKDKAQQKLIDKAAEPFNGKLNEYIENVRKTHDQIIDNVNIDEVLSAGWDEDRDKQAEYVINSFQEYIAEHKDEIRALRIFYDQPYNRRKLTYQEIKKALEQMKADQAQLTPQKVWEAFEHLGQTDMGIPENELVTFVSLLRYISDIDDKLVPYDKIVNKNFKEWVFQKNAGHEQFDDEQMEWLRKMKEHIAINYNFAMEDLDYAPFDQYGGKGRMYQLFGEDMNAIIDEMNEELAR